MQRGNTRSNREKSTPKLLPIGIKIVPCLGITFSIYGEFVIILFLILFLIVLYVPRGYLLVNLKTITIDKIAKKDKINLRLRASNSKSKNYREP